MFSNVCASAQSLSCVQFFVIPWDQDHPHGKEMQKSKMAVWGGLINSCEKKRGEKQRRKGKI